MNNTGNTVPTGAMSSYPSGAPVQAYNPPKKTYTPLIPSVNPALATQSSTVPASTGATTGATSPSLASQLATAHQSALDIQGQIAKLATNEQKQSATPATPTFGGLVGSLASTATQGSPKAQEYTQQAADYGKNSYDIGQQAQDIAKQFGQRYADVGGQGARFQAGQLTTGTTPVAEGNAAVTAQTTAAQQTALAQGEQAALQGLGYELTGANQAANAANAAAGQAYTGQGQTISGLNSAAGLAQPSPAAQGQTVFNPTTGKFEGGSYQTNLQTVVNAIKNGQVGYTTGVDSLSGLSPTAKADVLAALGPGFDTIASDAAATAKSSNIQTGGTATTTANAQGLAQSIQQETELNTAATNAQSLAAQVAEALTNVGLTSSTDANTTINNLQSRLGNDAFTKLNIAVNDARNAYQAILTATGATPTDAGAAANQNINANMSPNQIKAAIDQLNQGIKARQDAAHQQTKQYQSQLSGSGANTSSGSTAGSTGWY